MCSDLAFPDDDIDTPDWFEAVYSVVRSIPVGVVATYGQVADMVTGVSVSARQVGTAMRFAPADVPWQRVVGAGGRLPIAKRSPELVILQRRLLVEEGVPVTGTEFARVDMETAQLRSLIPPQS